jgi:hypothetical protein
MNVYNYIAEYNSDACFEICKKYGFFQISSTQELADCLEQIVGNEGEDAFKEVMDLHPDKAVILELYDKKKDEPTVEFVKPLQRNANGMGMGMGLRRMQNATGSGSGSIVNQTNTYILVGALIVSLAIISIKK